MLVCVGSVCLFVWVPCVGSLGGLGFLTAEVIHQCDGMACAQSWACGWKGGFWGWGKVLLSLLLRPLYCFSRCIPNRRYMHCLSRHGEV